MNWTATASALLLGLGGYAWGAHAGDDEEAAEPPSWAHYALHEVDAARREAGGAWRGFFDNPTLSMGLYVLRRGVPDGQAPHGLDEVYYVVEGRGKLSVDGEVLDVRPGSVVFVAAGAEHRFHDLESEELSALVFFSKAPPGGADEEEGEDG